MELLAQCGKCAQYQSQVILLLAEKRPTQLNQLISHRYSM